MSLSGEDKFGKGSNNYTKYGATEHLGGEVTANSASGRIGDLNLAGSAFIGGDTQGLKIGKVNVESAVNSYDLESKQTNKDIVSKSSTYIKSHQEENVAGNLQLSGARIEGNLTGIGSNIDLGENTFVGGKLTTDSRELHNSFYEKNTSRGFSAGISHGTASLNYGKSSSTYDEKDTINAKSNLRIGDGSVLNNGAEITATNFEYGNIQINNGDVKYGARIDTRDVKTTSRSSNFGVSIGINSPIKDRIEQAAGAVKQARRGDTIGGLVAGVNSVTGTVNGMSQNISRLDGNRATMQDIQAGNFKVNNDFYVSGGINARFNTSRSSNNSHTESAVITTMKPMNENSSITYNNVNNITYQGTQAQGGTFIYNNVKNIRKEAVELHNSYSSKNSGFGAGVSAGIGSNGQIKPSSIGGNVSASRSNQNTIETVYQNGNFQNVNEVHNNTGTMTLSGFNQEGGKVTGNIGKLVVESRQNTSTTTGSSSGIGIGISANGMPNSVNVNGSRTNGSRAFVDNQSSFIVGEGSNLHVGTVENTGAIIGKQSENGTTFKVDNYVGHDIQNYDTMTTTGISVGTSLGKSPRVTNIGFNQDDRDKQGITRNTVVGNVEIGEASGNPINRDVTKANEVTKDVQHSTNVNVESQTIEYATNPTKFKEDLEVAILEGKATGETVLKTIENLVNGGKEDIGDPERRSLNEIKEAVIRVKTAPEMNLIATGDLNSQEVLDTLKINGIEKFNPDDPDLPENVRARLDEVRKSGGEIEAFYDKTTNKIFINENVEDGETRALVAREWKISEDLKDGKGKANDEGQLKATVAGELAYDDMMKRAGEGKTGSISTDDLNVGVMDANSEVTSDNVLGWIGAQYKKVKKKVENSPTYKKIRKEIQKIQDNPIGYAKSVGEQKINHAVHNFTVAKNNAKKFYNNVAGFITGENKNVTRSKNAELDDDNKRSENERNKRDKRSQNNFIAETKNKVAKKNRDKESKKAINSLKEQIKATRDPKKRKKLQDQLEIVEPHTVREGLKSAGKVLKDTVASAPFIPVVEKVGKVVLASPSLTVGGLFLLTSQNMGTNDQFPHLKNLNNEKYSLKESEYIKNNYPYYYKDYEVSKKTTTKKNTFDKKKIDLEIAGKYSDKWKKEENARAIGEIAGGFLGGAVAKGISKTIVKNGSNSIYQNYAEKATKNANSTSVMLGKYNQDGISYIEAAGKEHTYFNLGDKGWNEAVNKVGESNMWEINKKFLEQQLQQGKTFYLSHDPMKASGYFQKEVNFLKDNGFKFIKDGDFWKAVKQ